MLDLADLEYYCYSGVWNAGLFWREWVQCNERRHHQKCLKTEKKFEESQEKVKQTRKTWTFTRIGSNIKQRTLRRNDGELQKLRKYRSCEEQDGTDLEDISVLPIPILPENGLHVPVDHSTFPCGAFTEILNAEFFHSPIIVKREKMSSNRGSSILRKELHVISKIHHPNILLLMGIVKMDVNVIVTVFEDASNGTLHHLLHQKKTTLPPMEIQKFLTQLCQVMLFLHERGWLHTAITSHAIVITANYTLKLTGFEMARKLNVTEDENSPSEYLSKQWFPWQSPEQLNGQPILSPETDVFSVGVISWEMCTNAEPWFGYTHDEIVIKYKSLNCALESEGLPSSFIHSKNESFISCIQDMLQIDPKKRISCFLDVLSLVHKLQVSEHIQPIHFIGSVERAQLLFQPRPQKATLTSSKQYDKQERDPYTGLKRVPNSWQKLNGKAPSTTSLDIVNLHSPRSTNSGKKNSSSQNFNKQCVNKLQIKNQFPFGNSKACSKSEQNNNIQQKQSGSRFTDKRIQGNIPIPFETSQLSEEKKNYIQPSQKLLFMSQLENSFSRSVPIKPASHLNQRAINFRSNSTKLIFKEQNIQHETILYPKLSRGNDSSDKGKWETSKPSKLHHNMKFEQEFSNQKVDSTKAIQTNISTCSKYLTIENRKQHSNLQDTKLKNGVEGQHSDYLHEKHSNGYQYSEETDCRSQKGHDTCNSDTESKDNGFESTDSGIFTIWREFDQNVLYQMNSTEDLYIDDEFGLEMELDSHMQLLGLFDSNSDYNEHFIDSIHSDLAENENLS